MMAIIMAIEDDDDREFVEKIFDRYEKNMYFTAYDILRNRADAEDCVQDTFVKIIDKLDCFKKAHEEGNLAKLVALVCRNTALDRYKGNKRRAKRQYSQTVYDENGESSVADIPDRSADVERLVMNSYVCAYVKELIDKLDLIIAWAARDCENDEAEKFKNIDTSGVVLSAGFYARKRRLIGRYKLRPALAVCRKCFVRVAVALMALMSIGFLTVMAIPNVRNAMFDAVVEWYEDYVSVRFEPSGAQEPDGTSDIDPDTTVASVTPPTKIEKIMKPTYVPQGAEEDIVLSNTFGVTIDYYSGDNMILSFTQTLFDNGKKLLDNGIPDMRDIEINGNSAITFRHESEGDVVIWTDGEYYYQLRSAALGIDELVKIASSVK